MNLGRDSFAPLFVTAKQSVSSYLIPYYREASLSTHWRQYARDGIIITLIVAGIVTVFRANSATYTFAQSNWSGGETANNANHASDRTGWNQYASKDSTTALMNGGADVEILAVASSTSQTSSTDFNLGTLSSATVSGGGAGASVILTASAPTPRWEGLAPSPANISSGGSLAVIDSSTIYSLVGNETTGFYRYSALTDTWTAMSATPGTIGVGGAMIYPGSGDYLYAFAGNASNIFYRYSLSANSWSTMAPVPGNVRRGGDLFYPGSGDFIYALPGHDSTGFYRYSISGNSWVAMTPILGSINDGAALASIGSGDYIYALRGNPSGGKDFYRYSISGNSWTVMASSTNAVGEGASLSYPGSGDYFYSTYGGSLQKYSISGNSWTVDGSAIPMAQMGSSLVYSGSDNIFYYTKGSQSKEFFRYNSSLTDGAGWTAIASSTQYFSLGASLVYPNSGDYVYASRGNGYQEFLRYSISGNTWSSRADVPTGMNYGGDIAYPGSGDYIYGYSGYSTTNFYRYSITNNSWTSRAATPAVTSFGTVLRPAGDGNYLYALRGSNKDFWRYSISDDTWTALASTTANVDSGTLAYPGTGDYIYATQLQGTGFYRYSISQNTWTTLTSAAISFYNPILIYPGSGDYLYLFKGGSSSKTAQRYSISKNSWSVIPGAPVNFQSGLSVTYAGGSYLYVQLGNSYDFYRYAVMSFAPSGTFTSSIMDTGNRSVFSTLAYTASTPTSTGLTVDVRAGNTATPDGSWTAWQTGITNGGDISALNDNRYVQYRVNLTSSDVSVTPTFSDITFNYANYASSTTLTSSPFDSSSSGNILASVTWSESLPSGTAVKFQLRSAPDATGAPGVWSGWMGPDGTDTTYFTASNGTDSIPAALTDATNDQWFQYKAVLTTTTANTPTLSDVTITYVVNAPPEFDTTFGTQGSTAIQIATSTDPDWGKVYIQYKVRDPDGTTGSNTAGYVTPSFEYDIGGGWVSIPAENLSTNATANKAVEEGSYTLYSATFDAAALIPDTYYASARIRVKVDDNEGANNLATAITSTFVLDTKAPTISSLHIDGRSSTSTVTFAATDDVSVKEYVLSNNAEFTPGGANPTGGIPQPVGNSSASVATGWTLATGTPKTVYLKLTDTLGNIATRSVTVPGTPSNVEYRDLSNVDTDTYRLFVAWNLYPDPVPEGAPFASYELYRSTDGSNYSVAYTSTNPEINYYLDTSVATTTTYYYKIAFVTSNGDRTLFSPVVSDLPDAKGGTNNGAIPLISSVSVTDVKNTSAKVTWTTDDLALSEVDFGTTASYGQVASNRSYVTDHGVYLTGLTPNTQYYYRVRSIDAFSGSATDDNGGAGYTFTTGGGPVISSVNVPSISDSTAEITWKTNIAANSYVSYSTSPTLLTSTEAGSDTLVESPFQHKVTLSGLTTDTLYYYKVTSTDGEGNTTVDDNQGSYYSFRTTNDEKDPVISDVSVPVKASDGAVITWKTDELATSQVEYGTASGSTTSYMYSTVEITTPSIFHSVTLSQETLRLGGETNKLNKKTTYYYRVKSTDPAGNSAYSAEGAFTTTEDGAVNILGGGYSNDTSAVSAVKPQISDVKVSDISPFGATVSFTTNKETRAIVQYGPDTNYTFSVGSAALAGTHKVILKGLQMNSTYHLQATAVDKAGQVAAAPDQTFKTTSLAEDLGKLSTLSDNLDSIQSKLENLIESALPSINPPFIEKPTVEDIGEDFARITWRTNVKAYGSVNYAEDGEYVKGGYVSEEAKTQEKNTEHSMDLLGLKPNTKYHFRVTSYVFPGATAQTADMTFTTRAGRVQAQVRERKKDSMRIVWNTAIPTTSVVTYKVRGSQSTMKKSEEGLTTSHDILLNNLQPATTYEIRAYGLTSEGNTVEARDTVVASTNEDTTPPAITNFKVDSALVPGRTDRTQTIVSWKTDEPATSVVYYEEGTGSTADKLSQVKDSGSVYTDNHVVILTNLRPGTIYRFQIVSADDANNMTKLPVRTIVTPSQSESIVDVIFKNFDDTFKFMRSVR